MTNNFLQDTIKKDFKIAFSYRLQFLFSFFSIFLSIAFIAIFSQLVDSANNKIFEEYGGSYFIFLFFGFITAEITILLLNTMPNKVREYQLTGIFEELIMSGQKESNIIIYSLGYPVLMLAFRLFIYFGCFVLIVNDLSFLTNLSFFGLTSLALFSMSLIGISLISVAVTVVYKSPNIINRSYLMLSSIFSGVAFPVEILPSGLSFISNMLPTTHFLKLFRFDSNSTVTIQNEMLGNYMILFFLSVSLFFIGIFLLKKSIKISKRNGSLLNY